MRSVTPTLTPRSLRHLLPERRLLITKAEGANKMVLGDEPPDGLGLNGVQDYTFTDQELTDILGYMESHDPVGAHPPFAAPSGNFQALQFLPRCAFQSTYSLSTATGG